MIRRLSIAEAEGFGFDEILDVRAPIEFEEDCISGATNLPVLENEERERIGTIYKQVSAFDARKQGAALVSRNIARHLEDHLSHKGKDFFPLIYCWRGGQRSGSMATVLADIGWQVAVLDGGYRAYRRHVIERIEEVASRFSFVVLNGFTGAGKTLVLKAIESEGGQVLDLEGLAQHKGSVFGGDPDSPQPPQKRFESLIYDRVRRFNPEAPIFLEAESAKIGRLNLPISLWSRMKVAPVIEIASPLEARARYLKRDYEDWLGDFERIDRTLDRLTRFHSRELLRCWKEMASEGAWTGLISSLLDEHYDRRYRVGGKGHFEEPSVRVTLTRHDMGSVAQAAREVLDEAEGLLDVAESVAESASGS